MIKFFSGLAGKVKAKPFLFIGLAVVVFWVFGKQVNKLLAWVRGRFQGAVISKDVQKKVAQDAGTSTETIEKNVRIETCKAVASAVYAALHEKPFSFLPRSIFGSVEDEDEIVSQCNSLKNGLEAKYMSSYYFEKYQIRLRGLLIKYVGTGLNSLGTSSYKDIRPEIWNNIN